MAADTRDRLVQAGEQLFHTQGYAATGLKQLLAESGASFASLYHFFPNGKAQLAEEVIRSSGADYVQLIDVFFNGSTDLPTAVRAFYGAAAETLTETDFAEASPIATVALEVASSNEGLRLATAEVFTNWIQTATARFIELGLREHAAHAFATAILAQLEGAFVLCRALRSTEPMTTAGQLMAAAARGVS
jgi:AcrR family transcriptional regulator